MRNETTKPETAAADAVAAAAAKAESTYWCGDLAHYTGKIDIEPKTRTLPERTLYEIQMAEGHRSGEFLWTKNAPKSVAAQNGGAA